MNAPTQSTMPPTPELTLIVAATSKMGIGLNGTLPWTGLKKEMAYFARVTKRVSDASKRNAVIMGRKTWESIPPKFRPLPNRTNIVISRSHPPFSKQTTEAGKEYFNANSLRSAIDGIAKGDEGAREEEGGNGVAGVENIFVIGGGEIYRAALEMKEARRVLLTRVLDEFECDTVFPVSLGGEEGEGEGWVKREKGELDSWVGENVPEGVQVEGGKDGQEGTRYVFEMWERVD